MAGGLGTRMKSATPKHLHPLLGPAHGRLGDRCRARRGRRRGSSSSRRPDSAGSYDGLEVAVQEAALGTGDAVRSARAALEGADGDVLVLQRRRARAHAGDGARARRHAPPRGRRRHGALVRARRRRARTAASCATATAGSHGSSRPPTRAPDELALARGQLRHLRLPGRDALARARPARAAQRAGRAVRHGHARPARRRRRGGRGARGARSRSRWRGSTRAPSSPLAAEALRDRINEAPHARRRDHRRSRHRRGSTPTSRSSPTSRSIPFSVLRGRDPDRAAASRSARSPYVRPGTVRRRGREDRDVRRGEGLHHRRPDEGAAPLLHRGRRDRRGHEHRRREHHRQLPARAGPARRARPGSAATSGPASTIRSMLLSTLATMLGLQRARSSRMMSLRDRSPGSPRGRRRRKGGSTTGMESVSATDIALPGLESSQVMTEPRPGSLDRARAVEAAHGVRRPLAPRARHAHRRAARRRARRGHARARSRTTRRYCRYDESIRGADVFIVQTGSPPVDKNLMELCS